MAKLQVELNYDRYTAPIVNSKRSALGKREIKGGLEIDFSTIPAGVLTNLLIDAVTAYVQVGLKTLDQETATTEDCQAAMKARLSLLQSGATSAPGQARKAPTRDPIVAAAKAQIKQAIQARSEEKILAAVLTKMVNDLFKLHKAWEKAGSDPAAKEAKAAQMVINALAAAKAAHDQRGAMSDSLAGLAAKAAKLSAEAKAKKAAAEAEETEASVEAPAPKPKAKAKPAAATR